MIIFKDYQFRSLKVVTVMLVKKSKKRDSLTKTKACRRNVGSYLPVDTRYIPDHLNPRPLCC